MTNIRYRVNTNVHKLRNIEGKVKLPSATYTVNLATVSDNSVHYQGTIHIWTYMIIMIMVLTKN